MLVIKEISTLETFIVRHPVLRAGKPIETCHFEGDDLATTHHFGIFDNENLVGVVTVLHNSSSLFEEEQQFQIRGMAVLDQYQKKGFGEQLLYHAEAFIGMQSANLLWFNARESALGFYEKLGYKKTGNLFEIPGVGPHFVMFKYF